jgi:hypothetical protein
MDYLEEDPSGKKFFWAEGGDFDRLNPKPEYLDMLGRVRDLMGKARQYHEVGEMAEASRQIHNAFEVISDYDTRGMDTPKGSRLSPPESDETSGIWAELMKFQQELFLSDTL